MIIGNDEAKLGVVLFQLGGPDSPGAVEPFLYNLFCDPDIINFPLALAGPQAPGALHFAQPRRVVREHYDAIGGHLRSACSPSARPAA